MPSKYDAINKLKAENPELTWTQAANQAGFEGEWTSYKGKAKPRSGDARGQARRRASFDKPSTEMAGYEAKRLQQESTRISAEAEMFGLEPTQIEHLADQEDVRNLTAGSGGDPTNKAIVKQSEARFKDRVKQKAPPGYAATLNPATDSVRVISHKFFDPIADPSTLPGVDIPFGSDIDAGLAKLQIKNGSIRFQRRAAMAAAAGGAVAPAFLGTAASASELQTRTQIAEQTQNPIDQLQQGIAGTSLALDAASYVPVAAVPAGIASAALDVTNLAIDTGREFIDFLGSIRLHRK
jgi:hypothetical protein